MFKLIRKLLLFLPLFCGMMYVSYRIDPSGLFWGAGYERMAVDYMLKGEYINGYQRLDGRELNEIYAREVDYAPQVIVNGSSRSLQIKSAILPGKTFYNAANVGADVYDFYTSYYIFEKEGKEPEVMILGIDPWIFSDSKESIDDRSNKKLFYEFIVEELGYEVENYVKEDPYKKYEALLDPSYFQASIKYYKTSQNTDLQPQIVEGNQVFEQNDIVKTPTGAIIYDQNMRIRPQEEADYAALTAANTDLLRMADFNELSPYYTKLFEDFIVYLQNKGIEVIFFLPSYHHYIYWAAEENMEKYHCLFEVEEYLKDIAEKYDIQLYGSYDPDAVGLTNKDFMDGYHMREASIYKVLKIV